MDSSEQRVKIAVQKTGRLTEHSIDLLERCGLKLTKSKDQLICYGENMPIDLLLVRDDDIPGLVSDDVCDLGIVGLDVADEKRMNWTSATAGWQSPALTICPTKISNRCRTRRSRQATQAS